MLGVASGERSTGVVAFMRMDPMKLAGKSVGVFEQIRQEREEQRRSRGRWRGDAVPVAARSGPEE